MITVYAHDETSGRYFKLRLTQRQAARVDNGAMISCGLTAPRDCSAAWLRKNGVEVPQQEWQHSGCQSSCILRGATKCSW